MKGILRLALLAVVANAMWHLFVPYRAFVRFKVAVQDSALDDLGRSEDDQSARVLALASQYGIPLTPANFTLRRDQTHTTTDGRFTQPIELFPTVWYPWTFSWHTDTLHFAPTRVDESGRPR